MSRVVGKVMAGALQLPVGGQCMGTLSGISGIPGSRTATGGPGYGVRLVVGR